MNSSKLTILSGGAAQGLVAALAAEFKAQTGCEIDGTFGAVGAMRDKLLSGAAGRSADPDPRADRRAGRSRPCRGGLGCRYRHRADGRRGAQRRSRARVGNAAGLRAALLAADAIYFPDPKLATAGIHFAKVIDRSASTADVASRLRTYPNGATAMRELAAARGGRPIGCTQVTEILNTPGAQLVAPLPEGFELATVYTAGVCTRARLA